MPWLWETVNDVKEECEKDRIKKANEAARNVRINVENHGNSGVAQLHLEKMSMEEQKQAEIDAMREATQRTLEDLNDSHYQKKRALAEKSSKEKSRILNEHEAKIKQREQERDTAAREQSQRTAGLRKDQDETIKKVEELKKENLREQIKEIGKTSELQKEITDAEKQLSEKHNREFHETEKKAYEDRLQVEKIVNDKSEEDYQMTQRSTQQVHDIALASLSNNLSFRVNQSMSEDIRVVATEITNAKELAAKIDRELNSTSEKLVPDMDMNTRKQASLKLEVTRIDLSQLTKAITSMERKAKKIVNKNDQMRLQEAFTEIRKKIRATADPITEIKREMNSMRVFDVSKRQIMMESVGAVIDLVEDLPQLDTGETKMKEMIQETNQNLTKRKEAIKNANEE